MSGTGRLAAALAVVVAGLACRAAVDRLLAQAGGGERVAAWAQLQSAADLVTGSCAAGVGAGLTVLVAAAPDRSGPLMRAALATGLGVSGMAFAGLALGALVLGARFGAAPVEPPLLALAAAAGWIAVVASLAASLWTGQQRQARVLLLACASGALAPSLGRAALALALLALSQRAVLGFLYGERFVAPDLAAALFYAGDFVRIASWLPLFALYALRRTTPLVASEFLSLPLFALMLWLLRDGLTLAGAAWLATYVVYAAFNAFALLRAVRSRP